MLSRQILRHSCIKNLSIRNSQFRFILSRSVSSLTDKQLDSVFKKIDTLEPCFMQRLRDIVSIPSVSSEPARRHELFKVSDFN